jgi:hypothetical protein
MPFLPGLAVVFVGIAGGGHGKVDHQVKAVVKGLHVQSKALPDAALRTLTRHKEGTKDIVRKLHVDGVVSAEIVGGHDIRLVIYDGNGELKTFQEFSLTGGALAADDLGTFKDSVEGDVVALRGRDTGPAPAVAQAEPEIEMDETPAPPPPAKPVAKLAAATKPPPAPAKPAPVKQVDDEMPAALGGGKPAPVSAPQHEAAPPRVTDRPATGSGPAAVETADASTVSVDEIEAATAGDGGGGNETEVHASSTGEGALHVGAGAGLGVAGRLFSPGPSTVVGYSSQPVGMVHVDGHIEPTARWRLAVVGETTLGMTTPMQNGNASTSMARWEATAGFAVLHGPIEIAPVLGFGRRTFSIDSTSPDRTPDGEYNYLIAGVTGSTKLGSHFGVRGNAVFEPVVSGTEPTEMALGDASRWAIDVGAGIDWHISHLYARAAVDYQRFQWSWDMAGARGAGGAVDNYVAGTLSVGADY